MYDLLDDDADRMVLGEMPFSLDPVSLGFDALAEAGLERHLNPPFLMAMLADGVNRLSAEDVDMRIPRADTTPYETREKDGLSIQLPGALFLAPAGGEGFTPHGDALLAGVAERAARHAAHPVVITTFAAEAAEGERLSAHVATRLSTLLLRDPGEFVIRQEVAPDATLGVRIMIVGAKP